MSTLLSHTMAAVDWMADASLQALDEAAEAAYAAREAAENKVTFSDVLEEVADFSGARQQVFMEALVSGDSYTVWLLCDQARDRLVERNLKEQQK